ncbi:hypothetical protein GCM10010246_05440 [Streptomyces cuspidosporus]|uniref:Uncharacterized protein n=1 Tax=Streptomyces cuspidosporus TaxID=66882 RepID=A0ABP5SBY0_9ACTN
MEEVLAAPSSRGRARTAGAGMPAGKVAATLVKAEAELDVTVMPPDHRAIIGLFATSGTAMRCEEPRTAARRRHAARVAG